jgi:hypothetical protein
MNTEQRQPGGARVNVTPEMMKSFKTVTCDCGGQLFHAGFVIKKISPLISPTGKEELYPIEVIVCEECGKVPSEFVAADMLPNNVVAKTSEIIKELKKQK